MGARRVVGGVIAALAVAGVVMSCRTRSDFSGCDAVVTRCSTVCDTFCDYWGCYPDCYQSCYDDCIVAPPPPPAVPVPPADAAAPPPASSTDAGASLCASCLVNEDCSAGALCLVPGGDAGVDAAAPGFCGAPCAVAGDPASCPTDFVCAAIGSSLQCVPASGNCP